MKKEWFVLQTLVGQEMKVQQSLKNRVAFEGAQEYFGQIEVPEQKVSEVKNGKKHIVSRKVFPGYVLVEMAFFKENGAYDPAVRGMAREEVTWNILRSTPGLVASWYMGPSMKAMTKKEIDAIFLDKPERGDEVRPKVNFNVNDTVKVIDGAFQGWTGVVSMVDPDKGKLTLEVNIFNRKAPVDVEYWQVEKVPVEELSEQNSPVQA